MRRRVIASVAALVVVMAIPFGARAAEAEAEEAKADHAKAPNPATISNVSIVSARTVKVTWNVNGLVLTCESICPAG